MEAEHLDRADQRLQARRGQQAAVLLAERVVDGAQVGQELLGRGVGVLRRHRVARGLAARELAQRGREPRIDAGQRAAIGLVLAVLAGVGRTLGQRLHLDRDVDQGGRERQFAAQVVHLGEVVAQRQLGLAAQRVLEGLGRDVGVAVAVAADPLAHAQEGRDRGRLAALRQRLLEVGIDARDLAQEGGLVVAQRVLDLVGHGELGEAQQARLPQLRDADADLRLVVGEFERRQRVGAAGIGLLAQADLVARGQQQRDGALGVEDALALHLGRVRGEHRRQVAVGQRGHDLVGLHAGLADARQRGLQVAVGAFAGALGLGAAADQVAVFRQVGQVAEVAEGADHAHGLGRGQALEQVLERAVGGLVGIAAEGHRQRADLLHQFIALLALLLPDHIAEDAAQQADVVDQRLVFGLPALRWGGRGLAGFHSMLFLETWSAVGMERRRRCCGATC